MHQQREEVEILFHLPHSQMDNVVFFESLADSLEVLPAMFRLRTRSLKENEFVGVLEIYNLTHPQCYKCSQIDVVSQQLRLLITNRGHPIVRNYKLDLLSTIEKHEERESLQYLEKNDFLSGEAIIDIVESQTQRIYGGGSICEGENASVIFEMKGNGPWQIYFTDSISPKPIQLNIPHSPYSLQGFFKKKKKEKTPS